MKTKWWLIGFLLCLALVCFSPLASASPDGLERVAEDKGFNGLAQEAPFQIIADYLFPWVENEALATILAGATGVIIIFGVAYGVAWLLKSKRVAS